jgi:hypothetical protein
MPDCEYCGESFAGEDQYLHHLHDEHYDELGNIDRRRVDDAVGDDDGGIPTGPLAVVGVVLAAALIVGYVVFVAGGNGGGGDGATVNGIAVEQTPTGEPFQGTHYHGTIEMAVGGEHVDFSQRQYQVQADAFHFENNDGERWHAHAPGVTLEYAMATLGIHVTESTVTYDGTTYRDGDEGTTVVVEVNGESVDPTSYVLQDGDAVHIEVRSA